MLYSRKEKFSEFAGVSKAYINFLGWLGAALVILGYYLNANKFSECWGIWIMGNIFVGIDCYKKEAYSAASMSFIIVLVNIYGYISWIK
jgi:nicotinamide riboside transporter PnuC